VGSFDRPAKGRSRVRVSVTLLKQGLENVVIEESTLFIRVV
jgi:hypothetical protein